MDFGIGQFLNSLLYRSSCSELVSLNRDKINLDRREFGVIGKGDKSRLVFVSDRSASSLEAYLKTREDVYNPLFIRYSGREILENRGRKCDYCKKH